MPEIRTDRIVSKPSTDTGRELITPVTTKERTTVIREKANKALTENGRCVTGAVAHSVSDKLLCIDCLST